MKIRLLLITGALAAAAPFAVVAPGAQPAGAASASWSLDGGTAGAIALTAVACADASHCVAAGTSGSDAVALVGSGSSWSSEPFAGSTQVNGLACASDSFCVAAGSTTVGSSSTGSLEVWNGSSWSSSYSGDTSFSSVSCPSATSCFAAGYSPSGGVVEVWNGSSWSSAETSATSGRLSGISCPTSSSCVALGANESLVFNGSSWSPIDFAPAGSGGISLGSLSCATTAYCVAVGSMSNATYGSPLTLAEEWNGMQWSVMPTANLAPGTSPPVGTGFAGGVLAGVSCTAADACVAVGYGGGGQDSNNLGYPAIALVETWDGTAWSMTPNAAPLELDGEHSGAPLRAVSCVPASGEVACSAAGSQTNSSGVESALVESTSSAIGSLNSASVSLTESAGNLTTTVSTNGAGTPTGTVTLVSAGSLIATCPPVVLNGSSGVTCPAGTSDGPYTVEYSGDANFDGATGALAAPASPPPGTISGLVSGGGSPLAGVCVYAYLGGNSFEAMTSSEGTYVIEGLTPGSYHVEFDPTCSDGRSSPYAIQFYSNESDLSTATPVVVTAQQATTGIGATLGSGGTISGRVTSGSGSSGEGNVCAVAIVKATGDVVNLTATESNGSYTIANLPAGIYVVFFDPLCLGNFAGSALAQEFDGPSTYFAGATPITVPGGDVATENMDLPLGATISGTVTALDAVNSNGICVELVDSHSGDLATLLLGKTSGNGVYSISSVPPGSYELQVDPTCLGTQHSDFPQALMGGSSPQVWSIAAGEKYVMMNDTVAASNAPVISTTPLPEGAVGSPYATTVSVSGGTPGFTWSATGLPSGLSIVPNSGQIVGTPTASGPFSAQVTVMDSSTPAYAVEASLSGDIAPAPAPPITTPTPPATTPTPAPTTNQPSPAPPQVSFVPPTAIVNAPKVVAQIVVALSVKSPPKSVALGAIASYALTLTPKSGKQQASGLIDVSTPISKRVGKKAVTVNKTLATARLRGKSVTIRINSATLGVGRHTITILYSAGPGFKSTSLVEHLTVNPKPRGATR